MIDLSIPDISKKEITYINKVLKSKQLVDGEFQSKCEKYIKNIFKSKYVALTQSCSSALEVAAILIDLKSKDEVLMPSFTFTSTANSIVMRGATPVFVDINSYDLNMDLQDLESKITNKTKAVIVVHYAGYSVDMTALLKLKKKYGFILIEDSAHAFLSKYKKKLLGTFGDISTFSFHATKNLVGSQCGAILINNKKYVTKADVILDKGTDRKKFVKFSSKKLKTSISKRKYYMWQDIGSEYRATELSSSILYAQLVRRNKIQSKRKKIWNYYFKNLSKEKSNLFAILKPSKNIEHSYHLFALIMKNRKLAVKLMNVLQKKKIFSSFHYIPLHISPFGKKIVKYKKLKVTESIYDRIVRIPLHSGLSSSQIKYISTQILKFLKKNEK